VRAPAGSRAHRLAAYPQCCADAFGIQRDRMNRDRKTGEPVVLELRSGNAAWATRLTGQVGVSRELPRSTCPGDPLALLS
jgi:hypothetical protein